MSAVTRIARRAFVALAFTFSALLPIALWGAGSLVVHLQAIREAPPRRALPPVPAPAYDPTRKIAVVVTGTAGAEMTDFLTPYEVLGATGAFNLYVVAPEQRVVPLATAAGPDGGIDLIPHFSLAGYDAAIGRAPDVIVIPFLPAFASGGERALVPWIRRQAERGALVVSICAGSEVLAATGLLDGGPSTTHPSYFTSHEARYPNVTWVRDVRYVERERTISSGAIASGMDATLVAVRRLLGRAEAERVAQQLGYTHLRFLDDPRYPTNLDAGIAIAAAVSPHRRTTGVLLYRGVGELEVGSVFDTYATALTTSLVSVASSPGPIETAHGMWLLPRQTVAEPAWFDRLIVPGRRIPAEVAAVADAWPGEVTRIHEGRVGFPYDAALADIATRDSVLEAASVAANLNYPIGHLALDGRRIPLGVVIVPALLAMLGVLAAVRVRRRYRMRKWSASSTLGSGSNASERSMTLRSSRTLPGQA